MDKVCDTCLYGIRVEGGKLGCVYSGICHTRDGQKTAWTPNKAARYADLKGRRFRPTFSSNIDFFEIRGYDAERDMVLTTAHPKSGSAFDDEIEKRYLAGPSRRATTWRCRWRISQARPSMYCTTTTCLRPPAPCANRSSVAHRAPAAITASARRTMPRGARPTGSNPAAIGLSWRNDNY